MAGMTGAEIYENFRDGDGPQGLHDCAAVVSEIARTYEDRAEQIRALLARMESAWQGEAAGSAQRGAGPLETEHTMAGAALFTAQDLTSRQAGSFSEARCRVVPVPPLPDLPVPGVIFTDPTAAMDFEEQIDKHNAAAQNNVDVMNGYSGASEYNTTHLPTRFGSLDADHAEIGIGTADATDPADDSPRRPLDDSDPSPRDSAPVGDDRAPGGSPESEGARPVGPTPGASRGPVPGSGPVHGSDSTTTPGAFQPGTAGQAIPPAEPPTSRPPGVPSTIAPGPGPGPGTVLPGPGRGAGTGSFPRDGVGGGTPGARPVGPRGGVPEPHNIQPRPVAQSPRGSMSASGLPVGAPGPGHRDKDTERKRPEWLEGGDPDELFGTDLPTAPPTIGAEDD